MPIHGIIFIYFIIFKIRIIYQNLSLSLFLKSFCYFRFLFKMDMTEFSKNMRKFLSKKEQEYGELKFILSRATEETSRFIDELLETITSYAKEHNMYNIKMYYDDDVSKPCNISQSIIYNYNYFVLNTNFSSQFLLAEDMLFGNVVNSWPTLSSYLFIQVILVLIMRVLAY